MTDKELTTAIATLVFKGTEWKVGEFGGDVLIYHSHINYIVDYCNNWNDLMPLVVEHKLSFWQDEATGDWYVNQTKRDMGVIICAIHSRKILRTKTHNVH